MDVSYSTKLLLLGPFLLLVSTIPSSESSSRRHLSTPLPKTPADMIRQYLAPHNAARGKLGLPPLKWSEKIAGFALRWAQKRHVDCELIHSNTDYGENLFWGSGSGWRVGDAVEAWAAEGEYYEHRTNTCKHHRDCLHYTQIVWRQSSKVGCARVTCKSGDTFITCNYNPHGNVIGQKPF